MAVAWRKTAAAALITARPRRCFFGKPVKPGLVGTHPSLEKLNDGDLVFHSDFRQVYATTLEKWIGVDSAVILGKKYGLLPLVG